jgi:hypothetical protein
MVMTTEQKEAALRLIYRATKEESLSSAYLLVDAAKRLDESIDVREYKDLCLANWMAREAQKRGTE